MWIFIYNIAFKSIFLFPFSFHLGRGSGGQPLPVPPPLGTSGLEQWGRIFTIYFVNMYIQYSLTKYGFWSASEAFSYFHFLSTWGEAQGDIPSLSRPRSVLRASNNEDVFLQYILSICIYNIALQNTDFGVLQKHFLISIFFPPGERLRGTSPPCPTPAQYFGPRTMNNYFVQCRSWKCVLSIFIYKIALQNMDLYVLYKLSKLCPCLWELTPPLPSKPGSATDSSLINFYCFGGQKKMSPGFWGKTSLPLSGEKINPLPGEYKTSLPWGGQSPPHRYQLVRPLCLAAYSRHIWTVA